MLVFFWGGGGAVCKCSKLYLNFQACALNIVCAIRFLAKFEFSVRATNKIRPKRARRSLDP